MIEDVFIWMSTDLYKNVAFMTEAIEKDIKFFQEARRELKEDPVFQEAARKCCRDQGKDEYIYIDLYIS